MAGAQIPKAAPGGPPGLLLPPLSPRGSKRAAARLHSRQTRYGAGCREQHPICSRTSANGSLLPLLLPALAPAEGIWKETACPEGPPPARPWVGHARRMRSAWPMASHGAGCCPGGLVRADPTQPLPCCAPRCVPSWSLSLAPKLSKPPSGCPAPHPWELGRWVPPGDAGASSRVPKPFIHPPPVDTPSPCPAPRGHGGCRCRRDLGT